LPGRREASRLWGRILSDLARDNRANRPGELNDLLDFEQRAYALGMPQQVLGVNSQEQRFKLLL
jgi:hypothetical protein